MIEATEGTKFNNFGNQWHVYFSNKGVVKKNSYTSEAEA